MHGASRNPRRETSADYHARRVWAGSLSIASTQEVASLSFPPGTKMFQFPGCGLRRLWIQQRIPGHDPRRVFPFGNPRIKAHQRLPVDIAVWWRPSSPLSAKNIRHPPLTA
jgi:hypothetical protein